jgi:hypothetical protein
MKRLGECVWSVTTPTTGRKNTGMRRLVDVVDLMVRWVVGDGTDHRQESVGGNMPVVGSHTTVA